MRNRDAKEKQHAGIKYLTIFFFSSHSFSSFVYLPLFSDEAKQQIAFILEKISALRPAEKLLLYLKMPGGHSEVGELKLFLLLKLFGQWPLGCYQQLRRFVFFVAGAPFASRHVNNFGFRVITRVQITVAFRLTLNPLKATWCNMRTPPHTTISDKLN